MEQKSHNREWVKTAAIIFLSVLLVLTFFSNTIMNRSLTEVATAMVTDGSITAKVRGTGTVVSNGTYEVKATETRKIQAVMVKKGSQVEPGDVLFVLGEGDSEELKQAVEQLYQLQLSYRRACIGASGSDYTLQNREISKAEDAYNEAAQVLSDAENAMNAAKKDMDAAKAEMEQDHGYDESAANAALKKQEAAQVKIEELEAAHQTVLDAAYAENEAAMNAYSSAVTAGRQEDESEEDYQARLAELNQKVQDTGALCTQIENTEEPALTKAKSDLQQAQDDYNRIVNSASGAAAENYQAKKEAYDAAVSAYNEAKAALDAADDNLTTLEYNLAQQKRSDGQSAALTGLELQELKRQIDAQQAVVDSLKGQGGDTIVAGSAGTVTDINIVAGQTAQKDQVLCNIIVNDMGYQLSFSVSNDQARRLRTGDTASVSNYYWGTSINATLVDISVDPQNPRSNKLLTFDVEGNVTVGNDLTLSVGSKSANYDITVPKSAIRTDSNGTFVLAIEAKNNALGNRYFAKRVAVEIIAEDDITCAVSGNLSWGDYVITTAAAPIKSGNQVRLAEN